ncbi:MAG TPA: 30S ribosomal protein S16 [Trueperaceae bacterium]|nr:30S ribosomal protein S16 [Trueperaceae bacterium]
MVKIRLTRMGSKRNPHYRMVVVDSRKKRSADYIEQIGYYDPRETTENALRVESERAAYWLQQGAQPSDTVVRLLEKVGVEVPAVHAKKRSDYVRRAEAKA